MEKKQTSKKALRSLINDSMREAIGNLQLPAPTKKIDKLLQRSSKKLALAFVSILNREYKKKRKAEKFMEDAIESKSKKK